MERLEFDCDFDLVEKIETILVDIDDEYPLISVYGKYDVIKTILEDLITDGFNIANEIELENYDVSYYDKEFVLYATEDGVNAEKIYYDDKYLYSCGDISFVHEDCSSTILKYIESDKVYEFGYSNEDEDDYEDGLGDNELEQEHEYIVNGEPVSVDEFNAFVSKFAPDKVIKTDDKPSTTFKETFKVNGKCVDKETYEKELAKFEDRYLDNIRDMLLRYAGFMDDWNDLLRLFY